MPRAIAAVVAAGMLFLPACGASCGEEERPRDAGEATGPCTFATCESECRGRGLCYGSCAGGRCNCAESCGSDAADGDEGMAGEADATGRDEGSADDADAWDPFECRYRATPETRPGASAGVTCRRLSVPEVETDPYQYSAVGSRGVLRGHNGAGRGLPLWEFDRATGCIRLLEDGSDILDAPPHYAKHPSIDGHLVAYQLTWDPTPNQHRCQLRLLDLNSGEKRVLDDTVSRVPTRSGSYLGCSMDYIVLDYPWVVWRDIREDDGGIKWDWLVLAMNVETGTKLNLSADPAAPHDVTGVWAAVRVDLLGTVAVWGTGDRRASNLGLPPNMIASVDLVSGERLAFERVDGERSFATITPTWIAWIDGRRLTAGCGYDCSTDIYGYNRATGEVRPLVVAGDSAQGREVDGEGPWLVYEDQRDGGLYPEYAGGDREQDIFALHLPTMTEIKITNWPGFELIPRAYDRGDGAYGVLLLWEISYGLATYMLWDCDLPEPEG